MYNKNFISLYIWQKSLDQMQWSIPKLHNVQIDR